LEHELVCMKHRSRACMEEEYDYDEEGEEKMDEEKEAAEGEA